MKTDRQWERERERNLKKKIGEDNPLPDRFTDFVYTRLPSLLPLAHLNLRSLRGRKQPEDVHNCSSKY